MKIFALVIPLILSFLFVVYILYILYTYKKHSNHYNLIIIVNNNNTIIEGVVNLIISELKKTYKSCNISIIDNSSDAETHLILQKLSKKYDFIKII
jgi:hypothetical protein